ncbi:hypothetical protein FB461_0683 [Rarobacter faecitabidus]|uniref:Uncharacterized protein n=1 Tax=Rarobacter faecitabidus TaxID=13243 RepID=A0A542ZV51_RARFA|nr:hypothetical protein FB461_0683 [Rarobacter faecitabidus]
MRHNLGLDNPDEVSCEDRIDLLEEHLRRDNRHVLITLAF